MAERMPPPERQMPTWFSSGAVGKVAPCVQCESIAAALLVVAREASGESPGLACPRSLLIAGAKANCSGLALGPPHFSAARCQPSLVLACMTRRTVVTQSAMSPIAAATSRTESLANDSAAAARNGHNPYIGGWRSSHSRIASWPRLHTAAVIAAHTPTRAARCICGVQKTREPSQHAISSPRPYPGISAPISHHSASRNCPNAEAGTITLAAPPEPAHCRLTSATCGARKR